MATRREQLLAYLDRRGIALGKAFAAGKLANQVNLLRYIAKYLATFVRGERPEYKAWVGRW